MPSVHQQGARKTYEPSEYAEEFGEDPARFLENGEKLAKARIRGIDDVQLLAAYADVERSRRNRQSMIRFIQRRVAALNND